MSVSSDEINFLVYRYLQESGFSHAAYAFAHESLVARSVFADAEVPPGALISFLQKGLQYVEIESHLQEDGAERACDEAFHLIAPHVCRLRAVMGRGGGGGGAGAAAADDGSGSGSGSVSASASAAATAAAAAAAANTAALAAVEAPASDVTILSGHVAEAFGVAWGAGGFLASCGADATARLWRVGEGNSGASGTETGPVLRHSVLDRDSTTSTSAPTRSKHGEPCDVTSLAWSPDGGRLATAGSDGRARVWAASGGLAHTLVGHTAPINALRWSPSGTLLATASGEFERASKKLPSAKRETWSERDVAFALDVAFTFVVDMERSDCGRRWGGGRGENAVGRSGAPLKAPQRFAPAPSALTLPPPPPPPRPWKLTRQIKLRSAISSFSGAQQR